MWQRLVMEFPDLYRGLLSACLTAWPSREGKEAAVSCGEGLGEQEQEQEREQGQEQEQELGSGAGTGAVAGARSMGKM